MPHKHQIYIEKFLELNNKQQNNCLSESKDLRNEPHLANLLFLSLLQKSAYRLANQMVEGDLVDLDAPGIQAFATDAPIMFKRLFIQCYQHHWPDTLLELIGSNLVDVDFVHPINKVTALQYVADEYMQCGVEVQKCQKALKQAAEGQLQFIDADDDDADLEDKVAAPMQANLAELQQALHIAEAKEQQLANTVSALVNAGANIDLPMPNGDALLFFALMYESPYLINLLVESGASLNQRSINGYSPIFAAIRKGLINQARSMVVMKSFDPKQKCKFNDRTWQNPFIITMTAFNYAIRRKQFDIAWMVLKRTGTFMRTKNFHIRNAQLYPAACKLTCWAVYTKNEKLLNASLKAVCDIEHGLAITVQYAAALGSRKIINATLTAYLRFFGAETDQEKINLQSALFQANLPSDGNTVIHTACLSKAKSTPAIQLLLAHGASLLARRRHPMDQDSQQSALELLLKRFDVDGSITVIETAFAASSLTDAQLRDELSYIIENFHNFGMSEAIQNKITAIFNFYFEFSPLENINVNNLTTMEGEEVLSFYGSLPGTSTFSTPTSGGSSASSADASASSQALAVPQAQAPLGVVIAGSLSFLSGNKGIHHENVAGYDSAEDREPKAKDSHRRRKQRSKHKEKDKDQEKKADTSSQSSKAHHGRHRHRKHRRHDDDDTPPPSPKL